MISSSQRRVRVVTVICIANLLAVIPTLGIYQKRTKSISTRKDIGFVRCYPPGLSGLSGLSDGSAHTVRA